VAEEPVVTILPRPYQIARAVERWFGQHKRLLPWRATYDPYAVWVSEVMAQQTRIEVVLRYFDRFLRCFPDVHSLANAPPDDVTALWSGLGYYRRAKMLREGAVDVVERFGGKVPQSVDELLSIAGIGRYTAGAIASIAFDKPAPIVDGNVARILARLEGLEDPVGSPALMRAAWSLEEELVAASRSPRDFNQGLMELGALICRAGKPSCGECPLRRHCVAFNSGRTNDLPVRKAKQLTRELRIPLYLISDDAGRILMRRESGKLMTGLFHLPHGDTSLLAGAPLRVKGKKLLGTFRHTVTTRRIEFELFAAKLADSIADEDSYEWIDAAAIERLPHPSYVAKALRLAEPRSRRRGGRL
jgi:A/G-specific adenine glycosylase